MRELIKECHKRAKSLKVCVLWLREHAARSHGESSIRNIPAALRLSLSVLCSLLLLQKEEGGRRRRKINAIIKRAARREQKQKIFVYQVARAQLKLLVCVRAGINLHQETQSKLPLNVA
jgi:hypothetical protein